MSANLDAKKAIVDEIKDKISKAKTVAFVDYRGLTVAEDTEMRANFRKNGCEYKVYKNRLVLRALNELGLTGCDKVFEGTNAVAFSYNDEVAACKILTDTIEKTKKMEIKGGVSNGAVVGADMIKTLANIPSREVLLTKLVFLLQSPVRGLAVCLDQVAKAKA